MRFTMRTLLLFPVLLGLVTAGVGHTSNSENSSDILETIVRGYDNVLTKIQTGSAVMVVSSIENLRDGNVNHYSATHNIRFSGPYLRWDFDATREEKSASTNSVKHLARYDVYIDKEKGISYDHDGIKYNIRTVDAPDPMTNPKMYHPGILPQDYGKPRYLQSKKVSSKFLRYEDINGRACALIETKRDDGTLTTIAHQWVDTEAYLVLKEKIWLQQNESQKAMLLEESKLQITLCDENNNIFGPREYKKLTYNYPDFSTGKTELKEEKWVTFENVIYNNQITKDELVMTIPKGASVADHIANMVYTAE